jgi:ornithine cyclodeaminase/alanine dehydrogenase-like protein (mu-crystallin family)
MAGSRHFVSANIYECLDDTPASRWVPGDRRPAIFSPFGMGILDVAVGDYVLRQLADEGSLAAVGDFFPVK